MAKKKEKIDKYIPMPLSDTYNDLEDILKINDELNVNEVCYYKDQTNNHYFMSIKEDLFSNIKEELEHYKFLLKEEKSKSKKILINEKISNINSIPKNIKNSWEELEFVQVCFNDGDILEESEVNKIKNKQKNIREQVKKLILINHFRKEKFITNYVTFLTDKPVVQCFIFPLITYTAYYFIKYVSKYGVSLFSFNINCFADFIFNFIFVEGFSYGIICLTSAVMYVLLNFINRCILNKILMNNSFIKDERKTFNKNIFSIIKTHLLCKIFGNIMSGGNNKNY